jgi:hypothetical protein
MLNWIDVTGKTKPQKDRVLICYCPEWCDSHYQVAHWNGNEFVYDEQPNDMFSGMVEKWAIFYEAD